MFMFSNRNKVQSHRRLTRVTMRHLYICVAVFVSHKECFLFPPSPPEVLLTKYDSSLLRASNSSRYVFSHFRKRTLRMSIQLHAYLIEMHRTTTPAQTRQPHTFTSHPQRRKLMRRTVARAHMLPASLAFPRHRVYWRHPKRRADTMDYMTVAVVTACVT